MNPELPLPLLGTGEDVVPFAGVLANPFPPEMIKGVRYLFILPYGSERWVSKAVAKLGLENTMRNRGDLTKVPGACEKIEFGPVINNVKH